MKVLKFIFDNLDYFKKRFALVFAVGMIDGFATFFIPATLAGFTKGNFTFTNFQKLVFFVFIFYASSLALQWTIRKYGESLGPQLANHIRTKYFKELEKLPVEELVKHHSGYLLSLINIVSGSISSIIFDVFWTYARSIATLTLFFYFTARESLLIAVINLAVLTVFVVFSTHLSRKMVTISERLNKKHASLLESYTDFLSNILTIKRLGVYPFAEKKLFQKTKDNYEEIGKLQNFHANRWFSLHGLFGVALISTIAFLLFNVTKGSISASILILFIAAYGTVRSHVERLSENFKSLIELKVYIENLESIVALTKGLKVGSNKPRSWGEIRFKNVHFRYPGTSKVIKISEFHIKKGEKICILGKSGEGKTTFLNLFANFLSPGPEKRFVDDKPYEGLSEDFFRERISLISQETELFNLSLRENLTLGRNVKDEKLLQVLQSLDLLTWVKNLNGGVNTVVGEKGVKISAGQKQRVNLARGILLDREILLLDEPTSHLDSRTEKVVISFLREFLRDKTCIIVSHRKELQDICDRGYVVSDGVLTKL